MTLKLSISGRAEADLTNQYRWYMDNAGESVAERFLAAFDATVASWHESRSWGVFAGFGTPNWRDCARWLWAGASVST